MIVSQEHLNRLGDLATHHPEFGYAHTDRQPKCYLSGPMTGLPFFNFGAFEVCASRLRYAGWFVYSPRENDCEAGITPDPDGRLQPGGPELKDLMRTDLWQVCDADAVIVMPGWEYSEGALLEVEVAHRVGVPVFTYLHGREIVAEQRAPHEFSSRVGGGGGRNNVILSVPGAEHVAHEAAQLPMADASSGTSPPAASPLDYGPTFPEGSPARKDLPVTTGVLDYFPAALAAVAAVSKHGNDKHNPGEHLHHARNKSMDHADAIGRHLIDRGFTDPDTGLRHSAELAWRALALLQQELEDAGEAPLARGASY